MIPIGAMTVKSGSDLKSGDIGFFLAPAPIPFVAGLLQNEVPYVVLFAADELRVLNINNLRGPAVIIEGAGIEIEPKSGREAPFGQVDGCPVYAGPNLFVEAIYRMDFYQIAIGVIDESQKGERVAFESWRIVFRAADTEYVILDRSPTAD